VGDLARLSKIPDIDVIEQSLEDVGDKEVQKAITDTGAKLYYYGAMKAAKSANLDVGNPHEMQALMDRVALTRFITLAPVPENTSMIMSSKSPESQVVNLTAFKRLQNLYRRLPALSIDRTSMPGSLAGGIQCPIAAETPG
jgi:hypothetical protein